MLAVSHFFGVTDRLVEELAKAVRDAVPGRHLAINMEGIDFLSMPEMAALLSAVHSAERRGVTASVSDLSPSLASLLNLAGVSLP